MSTVVDGFKHDNPDVVVLDSNGSVVAPLPLKKRPPRAPKKPKEDPDLNPTFEQLERLEHCIYIVGGQREMDYTRYFSSSAAIEPWEIKDVHRLKSLRHFWLVKNWRPRSDNKSVYVKNPLNPYGPCYW